MKIKRIFLLAPVSLTVITCLILFFNAKSINGTNDGWKIVKSIKVKPAVAVATFLNDKKGIIDDKGTFQYTMNTGLTWQKSTMKKGCIPYGINFANENDGFVYGCCNTNYATSDGGKNWSKITAEPVGDYGHVSFISGRNGWVGTTSKIKSTKDGGKTWADVDLPDDHFSIISISMIKENTGCFLDVNFNLFKTGDNGKNWEKIKLKIEPENYSLDTLYNSSAMRFYSENDGQIFLWQTKPDSSWINLSTDDGGATWKAGEMPGGKGFIFTSYDKKYVSILEMTNNLIVMKRNEKAR